MISISSEQIIENLDFSSPPKEIAALPFGEAVWPWMQVARKKLHEILPDIHSFLSKKAYASLETSLAKRLSSIATHSLLMEMGVKKLEAALQGETPRERYLDFIQGLHLANFFAEYHVLAKAVCSILSFWVEQTRVFLERYQGDREILQAEFNEGKTWGKILALSLNAGDVHNQGGAVMIVGFAKGKKIVYKPKNLALTKAFHQLLDELSSSNLTPSLKGYKVVVRGDYGWEEMVEQKPVQTKEEIERFYERSGMLLGLLYLLEGTDVHNQNYIAAGEYPQIIDLETLFHPRLKTENLDGADRLVNHSVLCTGMLPMFHFAKDGKRGPDISALGDMDKRTFTTSVWEDLNTDAMRLVEKSVSRKSKSPHRLIHQKNAVAAGEYETSIVQGFEKLYRHVMANKELIFKWLKTLDEAPVRCVLRATQFYAILLEQIFHPQVHLNSAALQKELGILDNVLDRDLEFLQPVIEQEKRELLAYDVPFFHSYVLSSHLCKNGKVLVENCLENPPCENVLAILNQLSEENCQLQRGYIRHAFAAKAAILHRDKQKLYMTAIKGPISEKKIWQSIFDIADRLKAKALVSDEGSLSWLYLEPNPTLNCYNFQPTSETLYSGRAGIALFFAALSRITQDKQWEEIALKTLIGIRKKLKKKNPVPMFDFGGFNGIGGVIYALTHVGQLLSKNELIDEALSLAQQIEEKHIKFDRQFDLIGGSAGLILALLSLYEMRKDPALLPIMHLCADHLCANAQTLPDGAFAWATPHSPRPLLGFSHGVAGIAYALFKLGAITKEEKYKDIAQASLLYERSLFSAKQGNWPRFYEQSTSYTSGWCHGACGIGLGRLATMPYFQDAIMLEEIATAIKTTQKLLCYGELSACCGLVGRLQLLLTHQPASHQETISTAVATLIHHLPTGVDWDNPSFMKGLSGIGYGLLSVLDKDRALPEALILK